MAVFDRSMTIGQERPGLPLEAGCDDEAVAPAWSPLRRFLFRFAFCYLIPQLLPAYLQVLDPIPYLGVPGGWYMDVWIACVPWIGRHVLHVAAPYRITGSTDSMFGWVQALCFLALSLAATLVWTLLDRRRTQYARLYEGLRIYVRIGLGIIMIDYGAGKVFPSQFPRPPLSRLLQPFGDASPMGLLWTFMGASVPYSAFAGLMEVTSGLLLLFRRTVALGALIGIGVLANVVMLNLCYDVPVKLFSGHLLLIALFLAAPDLPRLFALLVLRRPVVPQPDRPFFHRRWLRIGALALEGVLAVGFTGYQLKGCYEDSKLYASAAQTPLYGIWRVDGFQVDGHPRDARAADGLQWQNLVFDFPGVMSVQSPGDSRRPYSLELNAARKTLALTWPPDPKWRSVLTYGQPAPDHLTLAGTFDGHLIQASLHLVDSSKLQLPSGRFHWVSEFPHNR